MRCVNVLIGVECVVGVAGAGLVLIGLDLGMLYLGVAIGKLFGNIICFADFVDVLIVLLFVCSVVVDVLGVHQDTRKTAYHAKPHLCHIEGKGQRQGGVSSVGSDGCGGGGGISHALYYVKSQQGAGK